MILSFICRVGFSFSALPRCGHYTSSVSALYSVCFRIELRFCCLTIYSASWLLHLTIRQGRDVTVGTSVMNVSLHTAWGVGGFVKNTRDGGLGYSYQRCIGICQCCNWPSSNSGAKWMSDQKWASSFWSELFFSVISLFSSNALLLAVCKCTLYLIGACLVCY